MRTVFLGRENTFDLVLAADGKPKDASDYNRFVLYMRDKKDGTTVTIDSNSAPAGTFSTSNERFFKGSNIDVLRCLLGLGSFGLVAGRTYECWLRVYNAQITQGLVWPDHGDSLRIYVDSGQ